MRTIQSSAQKIYLLFAILSTALIFCTNLTEIHDVAIESSFNVYLVGKVLTKDGNPVPYAVAYLDKFDIYDTTDDNGEYKITVKKTEKSSYLPKTLSDTENILHISRDNQIITEMEIERLIDTLPNVVIVQRDIHGKVDTTEKSFSRMEAVVWDKADTIQRIAELFYSKQTKSFSGFVYFVYTGSKHEYAVFVNIYNADSRFIGRSDTIDFTSIAGDIEIPEVNPLNATPTVIAFCDTSAIGINDTFTLRGTAGDAYGGRIVQWFWDVGNTGNFTETTPDSTVITVAPSTSEESFECVLQATDNDSNIVYDTVTIAIETRAPIADAGADTVVEIGNDIKLDGSNSSDETGIIQYAWKINDGEWLTSENGDTTFTASSYPDIYRCSLAVTDDDETIGYDETFVFVREYNNGMVKIAAAGKSFEMGSTEYKDAQPVHIVSFTRDFWIDTIKVTWKQYTDVMASTYANFQSPWSIYDTETVAIDLTNWCDAILFCNALTSKSGSLDPVYQYTVSSTKVGDGNTQLEDVTIDYSKNGYRLPTEAEWEYMSRGYPAIDDYWRIDREGLDTIPNSFGIYGLQQSPFVWCNDYYSSSYDSENQVDPIGPDTGTYRVRRGGEGGSITHRGYEYPDLEYSDTGIRVVLPVQ